MQNCRTSNENATVFTVSMTMAILVLPKKMVDQKYPEQNLLQEKLSIHKFL